MRCFIIVPLFVLMLTRADGLSVMSVDLGSEFMKVAIVKPGVPMEIALNKESRRKTPVVVSIRDGERLFSDPAMNVAIRYPKNAYKYFLDLLGKKFSNPVVKAYQERFPYSQLEADPDTGLVNCRFDEDTIYSVEELTAMMLEFARDTAASFAEQPITETVITVPPYFNQAERRAMMRAGEMAGLKVLQLLNDNTAVALNYGVFRRKEFNGTAVHYMFVDMGASKTVATVVAYQLVKAKNSVTSLEETFPQLTIKGVGFDHTLGGREFQFRLRAHLADLFNKGRKTSSDVTKSPRAMEKLYKEAGRLKQVLSANAEHFAQVEGLLDDEDFRAKVSRQEFEEMNRDLFAQVDSVVKEALKTSHVTMDEISEVILMGGSTRVPKVQEHLQAATGREELGKSINTDEAAVLGASYQAAHLSKGYKVKKFGIKDANLFPIQMTFPPSWQVNDLDEDEEDYWVEFERVKSTDDSPDASKMVKRTLFGRMNPFPQKKVMTFNKHTKDFSFSVNYGELAFLREDFMMAFGKTNLQDVRLIGVEDAYTKHSTEAESKGTKAHFRMDDSGLLTVDRVESLFEKLVEAEEDGEKKEESTLSKIGSTISNLFGGSKKEEEKEGGVEETKEEAPEEEKPADQSEEKVVKDDNKQTDPEPASPGPKEGEDDDKKPSEEKPSGDAPGDTKPSDSETKQESDKPEDIVEKKPAKRTIVKEEITSESLAVDITDPPTEHIAASKQRVADLRKKDEEKRKLEAVKNEIEAFVFDMQDKLYQEKYEAASTEEEREGIREKCSATSDWLYEQDDTTERKVYEDKLSELKKSTKGLFERVYEHEERPKALAALNSIVNYTEYFLQGMKNLTGEDRPFTDVEVKTLETLIHGTKEWNMSMVRDQSETPLSEKPKLLVEDVGRKIGELDREVKYLINKMKTFKPKPKPKPKPENKTETAENKTTSADTKDEIQGSEDQEGKAETATGEEKAPSGEEKAPSGEEKEEVKVTDEVGDSAGDSEEPTLELPPTDTDEATDSPTADSTKTSGHPPPDEL